ncbi:DUF2062 domain-containing protein [Rhodobacterales bacterium HKCCE3408]|nr:DUF2062 domain-containing protein [Rhodobacterales bacterium HKCCE3408]
MVFKRRTPLSWGQAFLRFLWPRGGWGRAAQYVKHRVRRLPGTPEQIARGIFAGVFASFTPLYGLHFIFAGVLAWAMRGNVLAGLLGTFFGNPLTYVPISIISLRTGHFLLQTPPEHRRTRDVFDSMGHAAEALWFNFRALFTPERADWQGLHEFWGTVFFPWLVGGIIPGIIAGLVCYFISVPVIRAYQARRTARLRKRMIKLREQAGTGAADR